MNWTLRKHTDFDDGSIALFLDNERFAHKHEIIEAIPKDYGYLVKRFNHKDGTMDLLVDLLKLEKPAAPEEIVKLLCYIDVI